MMQRNPTISHSPRGDQATFPTAVHPKLNKLASGFQASVVTTPQNFHTPPAIIPPNTSNIKRMSMTMPPSP